MSRGHNNFDQQNKSWLGDYGVFSSFSLQWATWQSRYRNPRSYLSKIQSTHKFLSSHSTSFPLVCPSESPSQCFSLLSTASPSLMRVSDFCVLFSTCCFLNSGPRSLHAFPLYSAQCESELTVWWEKPRMCLFQIQDNFLGFLTVMFTTFLLSHLSLTCRWNWWLGVPWALS